MLRTLIFLVAIASASAGCGDTAKACTITGGAAIDAAAAKARCASKNTCIIIGPNAGGTGDNSQCGEMNNDPCSCGCYAGVCEYDKRSSADGTWQANSCCPKGFIANVPYNSNYTQNECSVPKPRTDCVAGATQGAARTGDDISYFTLNVWPVSNGVATFDLTQTLSAEGQALAEVVSRKGLWLIYNNETFPDGRLNVTMRFMASEAKFAACDFSGSCPMGLTWTTEIVDLGDGYGYVKQASTYWYPKAPGTYYLATEEKCNTAMKQAVTITDSEEKGFAPDTMFDTTCEANIAARSTGCVGCSGSHAHGGKLMLGETMASKCAIPWTAPVIQPVGAGFATAPKMAALGAVAAGMLLA